MPVPVARIAKLLNPLIVSVFTSYYKRRTPRALSLYYSACVYFCQVSVLGSDLFGFSLSSGNLCILIDETGPNRDLAPQDDVLFQTVQLVDLT